MFKVFGIHFTLSYDKFRLEKKVGFQIFKLYLTSLYTPSLLMTCSHIVCLTVSQNQQIAASDTFNGFLLSAQQVS